MAGEMTEQGFGLELIERQACLILYNEVNDEIQVQQDLWDDRDTEFSDVTGLEPSQITLELIEPENFYYGHKPSLINAAPDKYPNVSLMAYEGSPPPADKIDQGNDWRIILDVETMCKSDFNESEVNRRTHRTVEAVNQVLIRNEDLNGLSLGFDDDPTVQITDVFKAETSLSEHKDWFWQAARIRYNLTRHARLPI